ncbi:hypothetical protein ACFVW5_39925 [Streptomyces sp. NPDC058232]|uniref:hypothetical protein n=1 Tax=Streptomyces sp. NPDC058232 TaxID=3346393 RepID=UPI0036ED5AA6
MSSGRPTTGSPKWVTVGLAEDVPHGCVHDVRGIRTERDRERDPPEVAQPLKRFAPRTTLAETAEW